MARARQPAHLSDSTTAYRRPDPVTVAKIMDEYSADAAYERWGSLSARKICEIASEGRRLMSARGKVDTKAMRDCVCCERPFFSKSSANVVCLICKSETQAVFS